jgi:tRNA A22 N-methylase
VQQHIDVVDKDMYSDLLSSPDEKINNVAKNFMSGTVEIKKILKEFTRSWCKKSKSSLLINDHAEFLRDTDQLFDIVLERILDETEKLYPLVRSLS